MATDKGYDETDDGPAPGLGLPRASSGTPNIRAAAMKASGKVYPKDPELGKPNPYNPENKDLEIDVNNAYNLPEAQKVMSVPAAKGTGSSKEFIKDLVLNKGVPFGMAVGYFQRLYEEGDPVVKNLSDADETIRRLPGKLSTFIHGASDALGRPFVGAMDLAQKAADTISGTDSTKVFKPGLETLDEAAENRPPLTTRPGLKNALINNIPDLVGSAPAFVVGTEAVTGLLAQSLLRLPRFAKASAEVAELATKARLGKALLEPSAETAQTVARISRASNAVSNIATAAGFGALNGDDIKSSAEFAAALSLGALGLGKVWRWFRPNNLTRVQEFISKASGISSSEIGSRMENFAQIHATLVKLGAPDTIMQTFFDGVPGARWNRDVGEFFGNYLSKTGATTDELQKTLALLPAQAQKAVRGGWWKGVKADAENEGLNPEQYFARIARSQQERSLAKDFTGNPTKHNFVSVYVTGDTVTDSGARVYAGANSQFGKVAGPPNTRTKTFLDPFHVTYDPTKESWAEATIKQLSRPSIMGKEALELLNRFPFQNTVAYNDTAKELAFRVATKSGYSSIFAKGKGPNDRFFIDLLSHSPGKDTTTVADKIQKALDARSQKYFRDYPSVLLPIGIGAGVGAVTLFSPEQSQAIDFAALRKLITKVGLKGDELMASGAGSKFAEAASKEYGEGINWAITRAQSFLSNGDDSVNTLIDKLENLHNTVKKSPEKLQVQFLRPTGDEFLGNWVRVKVKHSDVRDAYLPDQPHTIADISGELGDDGIVRNIIADGYGPELLGSGVLKKLLREGPAHGITGWDDGNRVTGVASKNRARRSRAMIKYGVPIAVGYGLYDNQPADAAMAPGPLRELIERVIKGEAEFLSKPIVQRLSSDEKLVEYAARAEYLEKGIANLSHIDKEGKPVFSHYTGSTISNTLRKVGEESPVTADLFSNVVNRRAGYGVPVTVEQAINDYSKVVDDLKTKPIEIREHELVPLPENYDKNFVFHGTPKAFDEFDPDKLHNNALYGPGVYTTSEPEIASGYSRTKFHDLDNPVSNIHPMKIRSGLKFFDMDAKPKPEDVRKYYEARYGGILTDAEIEKYLSDDAKYNKGTNEGFYKNIQSGGPREVENALGDIRSVHPKEYVRDILQKELGYSGITHVGGGRTHHNPHRVWIVFDPEDLQPAHGLVAENKAPAYASIASSSVKVLPDPQQDIINEIRRLEGRNAWTPTDGVLEFDIGHPLAGNIAKVGGYIDPVDKTWYVNSKELEDSGIGPTGLASLVGAGIAAGFIKGARGNYSKLALIAAATGAAVLLGNTPEAEASPWSKFFSKGMKSVADDFITDLASTRSGEAATRIMNGYKQAAKEGLGEEYNSAADALFATIDTAPEKGLPKESLIRNLFALGRDPNEALTTAPYLFKLPAYAINHPLWERLHSMWLVKKERLLTGRNSAAVDLKERAGKILEPITLENFDEFTSAIEGLQRSSKDGSLTQTLPNVDAKINAAAKAYTTEIDDQLFRLHSGIHPDAPAILKEFGLEETPDTWKLLKFLQSNDYSQGVPLWNGRKITVQEIGSAERTRGMLNFEPWHDLETAKLRSGVLNKLPVANERATLLSEVKRLSDLYPNGAPQNVQSILDGIKNRLADLDEVEQKIKVRKSANLNYLPGKHYWGPISEGKEADIPDITRLKDAQAVSSRYIDGALAQAFFNEQLHFFRGGVAWLETEGQTHAAEYARTFLNVMRGLRSVNEDNYIAGRWNRLKGKGKDPKTIQSVRNLASDLMWIQFVGKLGLNPAYPIVNMTQPILTGVVLHPTNLISGFAKLLSDGSRIVKEAGEMGVLRAESQYGEELGRKLGKAVDWLPTKSENFNRAWVYQAGKMEALSKLRRGKFKLPSYVKPYFDHSVLEKGSPEEIAKAYGAAVTRSTQFMFGPEGRSLSFSGGAVRRVVGQFKAFQQGYANLLTTTAKNEPAAFFRLLGSLFLMGGASAVVGDWGGQKLVDLARMAVTNFGGDPNWVPDGSPLGKVFELFGFDSPIQLAGSATPISFQNFNPFTNAERFVDSAIGPTLSTGRQMGKSLINYASGQTDASTAFTGMVRPLLPGTIGIAGLEALQEAGIGAELLNQLKYRGGIYGPDGKKLVRDRDATGILARGLNLQPSVRSQRARYRGDIIAAMQNGDVNQAKTLLQEANRKGFVFTKSDIGSMKSVVTKQRNLSKPNR